jgi:opacity protein-like surface antigen
MRALLAALALALSASVAAAQAPQTPSTQKPPVRKAKRVWTNDDLDELKARSHWASGTDSSSGGSTQAGTPDGGASGDKQPPPPREKDPKTYQKQLAPLRAQLAQIDSQIRSLRNSLNNPISGTNSVNLGTATVTGRPEHQIEALEKQRQQIQQRIDAIEDEARRNGISPGDVR